MKRKRLTCGLLGALAGLAIASCSTPAKKPVAAEPMRPLDPAKRPVFESLQRPAGPMDGATADAQALRQRIEASRPGPARIAPTLIENQPGEVQRLKYTARDAAPEDVLRVLVRERLGRSYVLDPKLMEKRVGITLDVDAEMTREDVEDLLGGIAALYGWTIEDRGGTLIFCPTASLTRTPSAPILDADAAAPSDRPAARVFHLRYLAAKDAAEALKELVSDGAKIVIAGRSVLVSDRMRQLNRIARLLAALDVAPFEGVEIRTYELNNEKAADAAKMLGAMAQATQLSSQADPVVSFVPMPKGNRLLVISKDPSVQGAVSQWVEQVDQPLESTSRQRYLYRIQNFDPAKLNTLLRSTFMERLEKENDTESGLRLVVDAEEDLLVIYGTPRDYADVLAVLSRVDLPRQQVMMQCVIAEVRLAEQLQYGVEYFLQTEIDGSLLNLIGKATQLGPPDALATGSAFLLGSDGFAIVRALQQNTDVNILTQPRLFSRDKDIANFQFGGEVPIITANIDSSVQQGGTTGVRQEIQYKPTGIIIEMQPRINEAGDVTLHVRLEIRDVLPSTNSGIDSPEFTVRSIDTTAIVPHGATLMLGGIVDQRDAHRVGRIPILGSIPIVGLAFQNQDISDDRRELFLTVTPVIVTEPSDGQALVGDFLLTARGVENALRNFEGVLPAGLASAILEAEPIEIIDEPLPAPGNAPPADGASPPGEAPSKGARPPQRPAPAGAALGLAQVARALPDQQSEEMRLIVAFLSGLPGAAPGAPPGAIPGAGREP